jgi:hypothetical protein
LLHGFGLAQHLNRLSVQDAQETTADLREPNNDLYKATREMRKYGVKSAVAPALSSAVTQEWLVLDPVTEREDLNRNSRERGSDFSHLRFTGRHLARFIGTDGRFISSQPEWKTTESPQKHVAVTSVDWSNIVQAGSNPTLSVKLMPDGELAGAFGLPIPDVLKEADRWEREYELLRAEILSIYADLVTPSYIEEKVNAEVAVIESHTGRTLRRRRAKPPLRSLVVARERVIKAQSNEIIDTLENEITEDAQAPETAPREKRHMAKHRVVGHVRTINKEYRASPQARRLAWDEGIEMNDEPIILAEKGETYVKIHPRGDLPNESAGHRLSYRRQAPQRTKKKKN